MPDFLNGLFFSEILADNAGGSAVDVNGQGGANKQDEFIEIQNNSDSAIDLSGYQIWSDQNGLLHTFGAGDEIAASGGTATVVGTYVNPPSDFYDASGNNNSASSSGGFLEDGEGNKFDTLYLVAPNGDYIQLSYGQNLQPPGGLPAGFPTGGTLQGAGETINSGAPNATSILRDADGALIEGTPTPGVPGPVCFVTGTMISTDQGDIAVQDLVPGMRIASRNQDYVTLRAVRKAPIGKGVLRWNPDVRPIVVPVGVLGNTAPLRLSPAHSVLFKGAEVEMLFFKSEVLVPARHLVGKLGVYEDTTDASVVYYHLLFDEHEVILSDGCWSESLFLGAAAHAAIAAASGWRTEIDLDLDEMEHRQTACMVLKGYESALLLNALGAPLNEPCADKSIA